MVILILLPGLDGTGRLFGEFVKALGTETHTAIVPYPADKPLTYSQLEALVRARLPSDRPFILLGESFSGPIAASIAASSPPGLRGLVFTCSFVKNPRPAFSAFKALSAITPVRAVPTGLLSRVLLGRFSTPAARRTIEQIRAQVSSRVLRARIREVLSVNVAPLVPRVRVPVLYLRATEDRVVPRGASRIITELLPETMIVDIEAPHMLLQTAPDEAARYVQEFMQHPSVARWDTGEPQSLAAGPGS
jgi:pimeloyl-ACP methyl ester carboxylesterase